MFSATENDAFWQASDTYVAVAPHLAEQASSLKTFADDHEQARGLLFFQTSGSEGVQKWVGLSRSAFFASAQAVNLHLEAGESDRWLICLPLYHVGGFSILARCHVSGASYVRWEEKWNAQRFADFCTEEKITLTSLVPTQVYDLVQEGIEAPEMLRAIVVGGGALVQDLGRRAQALGWPVLQSYGMTESASQIATEPLEDLMTGYDPERLEVLKGWNLQTDAENRLTVRGDALASGYAVLNAEGWQWVAIGKEYQTRDFISLWPHGSRTYLRVLGRESEFVKVKGELINLATIQKRLNTLGSLAAVCALPDERRDSKLVLVLESTSTSHEVGQTIWDSYHADCPPADRFHELIYVDKIPRSDLGKLEMKRLREMLINR